LIAALLNPTLLPWLTSLAILVGSYAGARVVAWLLAHAIARLVQRRPAAVQPHLARALEPTLAYALFLAGALVAIERLPIERPWLGHVEQALLVWAIVLATVALLRGYGLLIQWMTTDSALARAEGLTVEFGPLVSKVGKVFIVLIGTIVVLERLGVNVASLVVSLGVGSLAVGLAAQDTLANMFAGFTLMLDRPFRIGERIQLASGEAGDVEAVGIRATRIRTGDDTILVVPNSVLVKDRLVNWSRPTRSVATRIDVVVAFGSDPARVRRLLVEAALASARCERERPPQAAIERIVETGVRFRLVFWVRDYVEQGAATDEISEALLKGFAEAGVEMAVPLRRLLAPATPGGPAAPAGTSA